MTKLFCFSFLLLTITSCYEATSGCKDVLATSYDVAADDPCDDDCCDYPELKLTISHRFGENTFSYDSLYINNLGQFYSFKYIHLYLSNAVLIDTFGNSLPISDFISITDDGNEETIIDDNISFTPGSFRFEFGTWIGSGVIKQLNFDIGLRSEITKSTVANESSHLINSIGDSLCIEPLIASTYISLDSVLTDNYAVFKTPARTPISIDLRQEISRGFDVTVVLNVDYAKWFEDVDFTQIDNIEPQIEIKNAELFELRD